MTNPDGHPTTEVKESRLHYLHSKMSKIFQETTSKPNRLEGRESGCVQKTSEPFTLDTPNGPRTVQLRYVRYRSDRVRAQLLGVRQEDRDGHSKILASNTRSFSREGGEILVGGKIVTSPESRGEGFGLAVAVLTDPLIQYTLDTQFPGTPAQALFADASKKGWTSEVFSSRLFRGLGFKQAGEGLFTKTYQPSK